MHFTPTILQHAGRDFCQALLSYFHQKALIIFNTPNTLVEKLDEKSSTKNSKMKIFSFNQENLLKEIEAIKEIIKEENGEDGDADDDKGKGGNNSKLGNGQKEASDCSDSEPSLDNFENDELVKLLPSLPKKKSN
jgi:hypothetical protein